MIQPKSIGALKCNIILLIKKPLVAPPKAAATNQVVISLSGQLKDNYPTLARVICMKC